MSRAPAFWFLYSSNFFIFGEGAIVLHCASIISNSQSIILHAYVGFLGDAIDGGLNCAPKLWWLNELGPPTAVK
jgi:hypothetical protein